MQNQLTYVEKTVETDGKAWRVVMNRLLAGLGCMQGLMIFSMSLSLFHRAVQCNAVQSAQCGRCIKAGKKHALTRPCTAADIP